MICDKLNENTIRFDEEIHFLMMKIIDKYEHKHKVHRLINKLLKQLKVIVSYFSMHVVVLFLEIYSDEDCVEKEFDDLVRVHVEEKIE